MLNQFGRPAITFVAVLTAYWLYSLLVAPWLAPDLEPSQPGRFSEIPPSGGSKPELERLFPPGSWELNDPKILATSQGMLLIKDFKPQPDGSVTLTPCTLVLLTGSESQKRSVVIQSPEGAVLRFDPPLDLTQAKMGRLVGGRLGGEITIYSPQSSPGADDRLEIKTKNLQIQEGRVWTPHDVNFRLGPNHGRGRDLSITLADDGRDGARRRPRSLAGSRVQMLQLGQVDYVKLSVRGEMLSEEGVSTPAGPKRQTELTIRCQGPFRFDFARRLATLHDKVDVLRHNPDGLADQLNCERLSLFFQGQTRGVERPSRNSANQLSSMKIQRLVAEGFPVILRAPSMGATVRGKRLEYDFNSRMVQMEDDQQVVMDYRPRKLRVAGRQIILQQDGDQQVLSVLSGANVQTEQAGAVQAERIHVWLARVTVQEDGREKQAMRPEKILAQDNVRIDSPKFQGAAKRLEVWIRYLGAVNSDASTNIAAAESNSFASNAFASTGSSGGDVPKSMFQLAGDLVRIQLLQAGKETLVDDVTVQDGVQLRQVSGRAAEAVEIRGDVLRLLRGSSEDMEVHVVGRPASAAARGAVMVGEKIQLLRSSNQLVINGPGNMTLQGNRQDAALPPASIRWEGSMQFDGRTAQFRRNIFATGSRRLKSGEVLNMTSQGQQLDVTLDRRIDFTRVENDQNRELYSLTFTGPVVMENTTLAGEERKSWDRMQVRNLTVNHQTGETSSEGQGWLQSVHVGQKHPSRDAAPLGNSETKSTIKFLRVDFDGGMAGNIIERRLRLSNNVRTLYGPVPSWRDQLQAQRRDDLGKEGVLMTSDVLNLLQTGPAEGKDLPFELIGEGNVSVEGSLFAARAARVSYVRDKDLLVLEGDGRADAQLWMSRQAAPDATARRILYSRKQNRIQAGDFRYVDLSRLVNGQGN